jgi:hypothetical protein
MIRTGRLGGWSLVAGQRQESGIISGQPVMWYISHLISLELRRAFMRPFEYILLELETKS